MTAGINFPGAAGEANAQGSLSGSLGLPGSSSEPAEWAHEKLFSLGVAAGTPGPESMILWTRLAPDPLAEDGHAGMPRHNVPVHWAVATDEACTQIVASGDALATPELAHSVHPEVTGLSPNTTYYYRFQAAGITSRIGRFRTLPPAGQSADKFTFVVASCQAWYHGHFTAWKHIAEEPELDLIVFNGDYIYEYPIIAGDNLWREGASVPPALTEKVETLAQYRLRYSLFKTDPHLQEAHASAAAAVVWDDHEVENNYTGDGSDTGTPTEHFLYQRAAAYRAYYENLPIGLAALPDGPHSRIYHSFDIGTLARFTNLDTRQYRDLPPTDDGGVHNPDRTMLGREQEAWVTQQLEDSPATWNFVTNGVVVAPIADDKIDQWDGFPAARERLFGALKKAQNPVVLTGDIHQHCAAELWDGATPGGKGSGKSIGVELVATSIASDGDGKAGTTSKDWMAQPWVKNMDQRRGYIRVSLSKDLMTSEFFVHPYIEKDDQAPKELAFAFETRAGEHTLKERR